MAIGSNQYPASPHSKNTSNTCTNPLHTGQNQETYRPKTAGNSLLVMNLLIPNLESCAKRATNAYDPRLSGVDERSESGTSFPESGTSFEDANKPQARSTT